MCVNRFKTLGGKNAAVALTNTDLKHMLCIEISAIQRSLVPAASPVSYNLNIQKCNLKKHY